MSVKAEMAQRDEIPPGTLYMLILKTLARGKELHGFEIANSIQQISDEVLQVEEGSLYPALQRMLVKGWVTAEWGTTSGNRRARYYRLTALGVQPRDAQLAAQRRFGNALLLRERSQDAWGWTWLVQMLQDVRYGARTL